MTEPTPSRETLIARYTPAAAIGALVLGAIVVALRFGPPAVVLWFAFAALAGGILLFWESMRAVLDTNAPGDEVALEGRDRNPSDLEDRKRAALHALRDIEFEHSIRRISDQDYAALKEQYRAEARAAMEAMDKGLGPFLSRAEELIAKAGSGGDTNENAGKRKKAKAKAASGSSDAAGGAEPVVKPAVMPSVSSEAEATASSSEAGDDDEPAATPASASEASSAPALEVASDTRTCSSCDTRNDADATFCKRCGTRMAGAA